jgi:hypothetical protein
VTAPQMHLRVGTATGDGDDPELVNELTWDLAETLRESPADDVERPRGQAQAGAKGTALEWAELIVSFSGGLPVILGYVRSWLRRQPGAKVTIELDGDKLVLEHSSPELQEQLARAFLARHAPPEPE